MTFLKKIFRLFKGITTLRLSRSREYLDIGWEALGSQARAQQMWQDLELDPCAHWLMFELLLHVASLVDKTASVTLTNASFS